MATLRNKRKLAAVTRKIEEERLRNSQSRNTSVPKINEEYITQIFENIEGRVTKKLSQEFSRTESRILDALSKLDEFLLNQQIQTHSETVPGTFRNTNVEDQGTNEDDSQSDPHPEAGIFRRQTYKTLAQKTVVTVCHLCFRINATQLFHTAEPDSSIRFKRQEPVTDSVENFQSFACALTFSYEQFRTSKLSLNFSGSSRECNNFRHVFDNFRISFSNSLEFFFENLTPKYISRDEECSFDNSVGVLSPKVQNF